MEKKDGTNCEFKIEVSRNINYSHFGVSINQVKFTRGEEFDKKSEVTCIYFLPKSNIF